MEYEKDVVSQTYIQLMSDTLHKKIKVLEALADLTLQQETILNSINFDEDEFLKLLSRKEEQINLLTKLDAGFEQLYDNTKQVLMNEKGKYQAEISDMKSCIATITDLSVKLQALEIRNKPKLELHLSNKRQQIKNSRISNKTVANYYKTVASQHETESFFYDKKK